MLEAAALYISIAIGKKLLDHAGDDAGNAFDASLRKLGRWVRDKVAGRPTAKVAIDMIAEAPAGDDGEATRDSGRKVLTAALEEVTADPTAASELEKLVAELKSLTPPGLVIDGHVVAGEVTDSVVIGAEARGPIPSGTEITGHVDVTTAKGSTIIGARSDGRPPGLGR
jgi:hypothetical protein